MMTGRRMTNEALAVAVKAGEPDALLLLWENLRRFIELKAHDYAREHRGTTEDDLIQAGFFAVLEAVERFEPERGGFITILKYTLLHQFAEEAGVRTSKRDASRYADSIDVAAYQDDPDGMTRAELLPDDGAALAYLGVEFSDFLDYTRRLLNAALSTIPANQAALVSLRHFEGLSYEQAAAGAGYSCKQAAKDAEKRAFMQLRRGSYSRELRDCLTAFEDFYELRGAARGSGSFRRTGISKTEAAALLGAENV